MSNSEAFVIPAGLIVSQGQDGLSIEHSGDIILHGTMGMALKQIRSTGGNVELHVDADLAEVSAAGHVIVGGALIVDTLKGERVEVRGGVQARSIDAGDGGALIDGDALVEQLSASGDVTVNGNVKATDLKTTAGSLHLNGAVEAKTISTAGNLHASGPVTADAVHADGTIAANHGVTARTLSGGTVELAGENLNISVVRAQESISVGAGAIRSDILIAPSVTLSADTTGKVTVVESHNNLSASAVKGCLSLTDLEEFGLDAQGFLDKHGIKPLGEPGGAPEPEVAEPEPDVVASIDEDETEDEEEDDEEEPEPEAPAEDNLAPIATAEADGEDTLSVELDISEDGLAELDGDSLLGEFELDEPNEPIDLDGLGELEPIEQASVEVELELGEASSTDESVEELFGLTIEEEDEEDEVYTQMVETIARIESCYEDSELPPMITLLSEMVEARNYEGIRNDITNIWNQLLKFHQKRGLRIQPQVTTTFNTINKIVREI